MLEILGRSLTYYSSSFTGFFSLFCCCCFWNFFLYVKNSFQSQIWSLMKTRICVFWWWWWLLLYSAILHSRADSLRSHVILHEWIAYFIARFLISTEVVYLQRWHGWCHMNLLPSRRVLCTPKNHAPCHFMQSHIRKVYDCLAVTCHLHFWSFTCYCGNTGVERIPK